MFFANSASDKMKIKITNTDSELLDFIEFETSVDTPAHYITRLANEKFSFDPKKLSVQTYKNEKITHN